MRTIAIDGEISSKSTNIRGSTLYTYTYMKESPNDRFFFFQSDG